MIVNWLGLVLYCMIGVGYKVKLPYLWKLNKYSYLSSPNIWILKNTSLKDSRIEMRRLLNK